MPSTVLSMTRRNQLVKYLECGNGYSRNRSESLGDIVLRASQRVSASIRDAKEAAFNDSWAERRENACKYAKSYVVDEDWAALAKYLGEDAAEDAFIAWVLKYDADGNGPMPVRNERDQYSAGREVIAEAQTKLRDARESIMLTDSVMVAEQTIGDIKNYLRGLERRLTA